MLIWSAWHVEATWELLKIRKLILTATSHKMIRLCSNKWDRGDARSANWAVLEACQEVSGRSKSQQKLCKYACFVDPIKKS